MAMTPTSRDIAGDIWSYAGAHINTRARAVRMMEPSLEPSLERDWVTWHPDVVDGDRLDQAIDEAIDEAIEALDEE